jgi:hypothetical protein
MSLTKVSYSMITGAPVNVLDFGAKGDGVTDDTAAIQAAIVFCEDNILPLYFPSNAVSQYYKTTAPLVVSKPLTMTGESSRNVTILAVGLTAGQFVLDIDGTAFGTYQNGKFGGFTLFAGSGNCMSIKNVSLSEFDDIGLRNCVQGIVYTGTRCFSNVFRRVEIVTALSGNTFIMTSHTGGGHHSFYDCTFGGNTGVNISTDTLTDSVNFYACNFEQCTVNSFFCGGTVSGLGFYGCRTEGCDGSDFQINPDISDVVSGLVVEGCAFSASDSGGSPRIILGGTGGKVRGFNINANSVSHGGNNFSSFLVQLNGDGESGTVANNYLDGDKALCAPTNVRRANVAIYNNEAKNGKFEPQLTLQNGTWTPTDVSGAGLTFTTAAGTFTKIGRMVFWQAVVVYPVTANGASAQFSLPPNLAPETGGAAQGRAGAGAPITDSIVVGALQFSTGVGLYQAGLIVATNADMSGKQIFIGGSYITLGV